MKVLAGTSNLKLCKDIARQLKLKLVNSHIKRFADGEVYIEINENIRGNSIFVVQSTSNPANDNLMELLICIDALRRSSAKNITAVIPYFGYARQDRKVVPRTAISAKLVSNLITNAGANRILSVDLHAGQIQGFFDIPVDNLFATPIFARHIKNKNKLKNVICVAPDVGGVERTRALSRRINSTIAIIDKRRPAPGKSEVMNLVGNVKNKNCIIMVAVISERRMNRLTNPALSVGLPPFLTKKPGLNSGMMLAQYTADALIAETRILSHPAANQSIPAAADQEDFVSMGLTTSQKVKKILDNCYGVLAIEMMAAAQALDLRGKNMGKGTSAAHKVVRKYVDFLDDDRPLYKDNNRMVELLKTDEIIDAVENVLGKELN